VNGDIVLVDAGPLIAWLISTDAHHAWAREQFVALRAPVLTCEPVLSEASHMVRKHGGDPAAVLALMERRIVETSFTIEDHVPELLQLMRRYKDVPMSLADACLVRMTEIHRKCKVLTTDSDFRHYRRNNRQVIPLIAPW